MATAPVKNSAEVQGIRRARPPMCSISRVWVACTTEPAERKSRLLKRAWFREWKSAPSRLMVARRGRSGTEKMTKRPIPIKMMPIFSMLE